MDPTGPVAQRFPLLPRPRPICSPLTVRVERICDLARTAVRDGDRAAASAVHNLAALLASDCCLPDVARTWCHRHARLYLDAIPLDGKSARCALEPLVNLARIHTRAGEGDTAYHLLTSLYEAVTTRTDVRIGGTDVPASILTATGDDHQDLCRWLWTVILADAPRALITAGRWHDARAHLERHNGIGHRLLDGLQVAIIATLTTGDSDAALALLDSSACHEPWEHAVAACLTVLCGRTTDPTVTAMLHHHRQLTPSPEHAVFHARLGLSVIDATDVASHPDAPTVAALIRRTLAARDGYATRDLLAHQQVAAALSPDQLQDAHDIVQQCALGQQSLPTDLRDALDTALNSTAIHLSHTLQGASELSADQAARTRLKR